MKRQEYPRPQFVRKNWENLNGEWLFAFDDNDLGVKEKWYADDQFFDQKINVPFVYQSKESGIENRTPHDIVWYKRTFEMKPTEDEVVILHFGAVDYQADVYVNNQHVGRHIGGHTSFEYDISHHLDPSGIQEVSVRALDPHYDESIPRGKQFWEDESAAIWYTNSTGIWQTVWLETVNKSHISDLKLTPHFDSGKIEIEAQVSQLANNTALEYQISFKGEKVAKGVLDIVSNKIIFEVELYQDHIFRTNYHNDGWSWTPETPNLFNLELILRKEQAIVDEVKSYFGMRKVHTDNGMVYLNNKPYYQKLVLDQGYWPTGLLTAPEDSDFKLDIELSKQMGFNGCRKHQKMEDPRFMYWADTLGFLVWGECAAPPVYTRDAVERLMIEWSDILKRDYNHPSIITWVPVNESWGVPNISFDRQQQHFSQAIYNYIHSLDTTRLVISNDGWAATDTDIVAIHNYQHGGDEEVEKYQYFKESLATREKLLSNISTPWPILAEGFDYKNQPILLTEFGGIGFDVSGQPGWGYTSVNNEEAFIRDYKRIMTALYASVGLWGYCYTQITDVEQEINGLLTYNRQPKCDLNEIRKINEMFHVFSVE